MEYSICDYTWMNKVFIFGSVFCFGAVLLGILTYTNHTSDIYIKQFRKYRSISSHTTQP